MTKKKKTEKIFNRTLRNENYNNWILKLNELIYYTIRPTEKRTHEMNCNAEEISENVEKRGKRLKTQKRS